MVSSAVDNLSHVISRCWWVRTTFLGFRNVDKSVNLAFIDKPWFIVFTQTFFIDSFRATDKVCRCHHLEDGYSYIHSSLELNLVGTHTTNSTSYFKAIVVNAILFLFFFNGHWNYRFSICLYWVSVHTNMLTYIIYFIILYNILLSE